METLDGQDMGAAPAPGPMAGMPIHPGILKEPRGLIRILQVLFAILAFGSIIGFETKSKLEVTCPSTKKEIFKSTISYPVEYPFKFHDVTIFERFNCTKDMPMIQQKFPMDFSSSACFFVFTGSLSVIYSIAALTLYLTKNDKYMTNPLIPVVDLAVTLIIAVFWVAGAGAWAFCVSDLKYYTNPRYLKGHIHICRDPLSDCAVTDLGNWATLNISILCGFTNAFLWVASCWFVFKETSFHQKNPMAQVPQGAYPPGYDPALQQQPGFPAHVQQQPFPPQQQGFTAQY